MQSRIDPHDFLVAMALKELNRIPGVFAWQNLSVGDVKIGGWRPGQYKKIPADTERGVADIQVVWNGRYMEFEAKATKRKASHRLSADQIGHRDRVRAVGGIFEAFDEHNWPAQYIQNLISGDST